MTAKELLDKLSVVVKDGNGDREILVMVVEDGITQADTIVDCFAAQSVDGDVVWISTK